jgi:hypothetical protein
VPEPPRPGRCTFTGSEASLRGCTITPASGAPRPVSCGSGTAQVNPAFRTDLDEVLENVGHSLDVLIKD